MSTPLQQPYDATPATSDERTWSILAHLSAIIAAVVSLGWLSLLGPLIVWLLKKDTSPHVRKAAAGAFNFNLSFWILYVVSWIMIFTVILLPVGVVLLVVLFVVAAWCHIKGALRASKGRPYDYPFQIRVLS